MRRNEKIERYLREHPGISPERLQKKFGFTYREAERLLNESLGNRAVLRSHFRFTVVFAEFFRRVFSSEIRRLSGLIGLAAFVRLVYAYFLSGHPDLRLPLLDAAYYVEWGKNIVANGWLGDKVFFTEPLYAYVLAVFFSLFSEETAETAVLAVQWSLGCLLPVVIYFLAKRLFDERVAVVSGVLAASYGPFLFYEGLLLKTSLEVFVLPLFALLLLSIFSRTEARYFFALGLALGLLILVKGNNVILWPLVAGMIFFLRRTLAIQRRFLLMAAFTFGVALCIIPVTIRNFIVGHDIVLTNFSAGLVVYQGSWYGSDGTTSLVPPFLRPDPKYEETDAVKMAEAFEGRTLKPSEVSGFWMRKAWQEILADPWHAVLTVGYKALLIVNRGEASDNYGYAYYRSQMPFLWFLPSTWLILTLGLAGLGWSCFERFSRTVSVWDISVDLEEKRQAFLLVLVIVGGYFAVLLAATINSRYRLPLLPFLIIFSGALLVSLRAFLYERFYRRMKIIGLSLLFVGIISALPLRVFSAIGDATALHTIGAAHLDRGNEGRAGEYFERAKGADEKYAWAYGNLFSIALRQGDRERALENLQELIVLRSDDLSNFEKLRMFKESEEKQGGALRKFVEDEEARLTHPRYDPFAYEGARFLASGDSTRARELFEQSIEQLGPSEISLTTLAIIAKGAGDTASAKRYYEEAIALNRWLLPARYNLANIALQENDYPRVEELLKDVYDTVPELGDAWYSYIIALTKTGKNSEAGEAAKKYVERYKDDPAKKDRVERFEKALSSTPSSPADEVLKKMKQ